MIMESNQETNPQLLTTIKENEKQCQTSIPCDASTETALTAIENKLVKMVIKEMEPVMNLAASLAEQARENHKNYEYVRRMAKEFSSFMNVTTTKINSFETELKNCQKNTNLALKEQMKEYNNHLSTIKRENKTEITVLHNKLDSQMQIIQAEQSALKYELNKINKMDKQEIIMQIENCNENVNFIYQKLKNEIVIIEKSTQDGNPFIKNIDVMKDNIELIKELPNIFKIQNQETKLQNVVLQTELEILKQDLSNDKNRIEKLEHDQTETKSVILDNKMDISNLQQNIDLIRCDFLKDIQIVQQNLKDNKDEIEKTTQELLKNLLSDKNILNKLENAKTEIKLAILDNKIDISNLQKDIDLIRHVTLKDIQIVQQNLKENKNEIEKTIEELQTNLLIDKNVLKKLRNDQTESTSAILNNKIDIIDLQKAIDLIRHDTLKDIQKMQQNLKDKNDEIEKTTQDLMMNLLCNQNMLKKLEHDQTESKSAMLNNKIDISNLQKDIDLIRHDILKDIQIVQQKLKDNKEDIEKGIEKLLENIVARDTFLQLKKNVCNLDVDVLKKDLQIVKDKIISENELQSKELTQKIDEYNNNIQLQINSLNDQLIVFDSQNKIFIESKTKEITSKINVLSLQMYIIIRFLNWMCKSSTYKELADGNSLLTDILHTQPQDFFLLIINIEANVNCKNKHSELLLHAASNIGLLFMVNILIEKGADIKRKNRIGWCPLHYASLNGYLSVVETLIKLGANVNSQTRYGWCPLHYASWEGHLSVVETLIKHGANVNSQTKYEEYPLHKAANNGHLPVVKMLIKYGANINNQDWFGQIPLYLAAYNGQLLVVEELLKYGADSNIQDNNGRSSLHLAANRGYLPVVEMLVKRGANVNSQTEGNETALSLAKNEDIKKFLIQHGAK